MAKAVLTLAVFAKEYGDFIEYHRNKYNINNDLATSDQLTDSLAFLKGWKIELLDKQKTEIRELNVLIEKTLELMNAMNELEKFSKNRKVSMDGVKADLILPEEVDYYWVIMAVIACVNKFTTILTSSYQQLVGEDDLKGTILNSEQDYGGVLSLWETRCST
uniref:Sieve element occlusion N-terminal domain-containing protein n=1 Tax=Cannabis sativa TaxID=3483 RepID=A0A803Q102_CANSA